MTDRLLTAIAPATARRLGAWRRLTLEALSAIGERLRATPRMSDGERDMDAALRAGLRPVRVAARMRGPSRR